MRKLLFVGTLISVVFGGAVLIAQSTNLAENGSGGVSSFSQEEQKNLTPETLQQSLEDFKEGIKDGIIKPEDVPPHLLFLLNDDKIHEPTRTINNPEIVSCFDYYTFGSIDADITSETSSVVSGTSMVFMGTLTNNNPYPIVEGTLYVKVFKNIGTEKNPNGPDVVDQFIAVDNVTLPANGSVPVSFTWQVPAYATSGEYRIGTYFTSDKKFNLLGLSFTDDIVGNVFHFTVSGEQKSIMMLDKSSVIINDNSYHFAAYPPRIEPDKQANISLTIINDTPNNQIAQIEWKLYKWDAMNEKNLVRTFQTTTAVKSNSTEKVSLEIPEQKEPVYLLIGTMTYQDTKSIVNIRFVREGVDKVRLNFPSITSYPIQKDTPITLFTCLHNSGQSAQVSNNKVVLEIVDKNEGIIESYTYEGGVTGDMMAVKKDFVPKKNLNNFTIYASLYTDGELVDESVMEYDCSRIDLTKCPPDEKGVFGVRETNVSMIGILILVLVTVSITIFFIKRKNHTIISLLLLVSLGCIFYPQGAEAKSATWSKNFNNKLAYFWSQDSNVTTPYNYGLNWAAALKDFHINVVYNVKITNLDTGGEIVNGSSVPVGTKIKLNFLKHEYTDISWFGTGYSADSPYGEWREEGTNPPKVDTCIDKDFITKVSLTDYNLRVYIPLVIDSPNKTITSLSGLSNCKTDAQTEIAGMSMECTVSAAGTISPKFNFSATKGKFYYRYKPDKTISYLNKGQCYGNNLPLYEAKEFYAMEGFGEYVAYATGITQDSLFIVNVPEKSVTYAFTAYTPPPANRPPLAPTITGAATGQVSTAYTFNFQATDPDGDTISYGVDWDNNGVVDQWLPASGTVSSGTSQSASKSWSTVGAKTFQALTKDSKGALSTTWGRFTITLVHPPVNAVCTVSVPTSNPNQPVTWTATVSGGTGVYTYSWSGTEGLTGATNPLTKIYTTSGNKSATVNVTSGTQNKTITCPSVVVASDVCGNIGDFQGGVPAGLTQSGGNCICPM